MTTTFLLIASLALLATLIPYTIRVARHGGYHSSSLSHVENDWASGSLPSSYYGSSSSPSSLR